MSTRLPGVARSPLARRGLIIGTTALSAVGFAAAASLIRQPEPAAPEAPPVVEPSEAPGSAHARLTALAGEWETLSTISIDGAAVADAEAGRARVESIMDGRFIAVHETGTTFGEPTSSLKMYGYNNAAGLYEATWVYTGSTAMMRARGIADPDTGVLTFQAQYASGAEEQERFIITLVAPGWNARAEAQADAPAPDRFTITLVALMPDGTAGPTLETVYTRAR